jgi:hypothetical protein
VRIRKKVPKQKRKRRGKKRNERTPTRTGKELALGLLYAPRADIMAAFLRKFLHLDVRSTKEKKKRPNATQKKTTTTTTTVPIDFI